MRSNALTQHWWSLSWSLQWTSSGQNFCHCRVLEQLRLEQSLNLHILVSWPIIQGSMVPHLDLNIRFHVHTSVSTDILQSSLCTKLKLLEKWWNLVKPQACLQWRITSVCHALRLVLENHLIVNRTWKKKGAMEKLLSCLKKSTLESLLRVFCLACRYMLSI